MTEAAYTFTLPSVEDDVTLDCRIHHPKGISALLNGKNGKNGHIKGAVFAHPYAPLGGNSDDLVVLSVTETLLEAGYIVATFNFRGAGGSQGRTTWTGRAETEDYVSVAGFMIYHLHHLKANHESDALATIPSAGNQLLEQRSAVPTEGSGHRSVSLLLGGYSYGSLVVARLPSPQTIISHFQEAPLGTAAAEIILRARTLAKQTLRTAQEVSQSPANSRGRSLKAENAATSPTQHLRASPVMVGGEETDSSERRRSRDSKRSMDAMRKSIEAPLRIKAHLRKHSNKPKEEAALEKQSRKPAGDDGVAPVVTVCYLMVSPVLLPFTNTLCPPGPPVPTMGSRKRAADGNVGSVFLQRPTLAIFGSSDSFTSSRRLRAWAEKQTQASMASNFTWKQADGAGHFWLEEGAMQAMQHRIAAWIRSMLPSG